MAYNLTFSTAGNYDASTGRVITSDGAASLTYADAVASLGASLSTSTFTITHTGTSAWTFVGGVGNDHAIGATGADILTGKDGNDTLDGAAGNDVLWGGAGSDTLIGGAGADTFKFGTADGTDIIDGITTGDVVNLYDMNYADVKTHFTTGAATGAVSLNYDANTGLLVSGYTDGNLVTFNTKDGVAFRLGVTGATLKYDSSVKMLGIASAANVGVTAAAQTAAVTIELADTTKYENIKGATGSDYNDYLRGAATDDTLMGGKGADNLWGGKNGGTDVMDGGAADNAADTFWFGIGDGNDRIDNFGKGDVVNLYNANFADLTFGTTGVVNLGAETVSLNGFTVDADSNNVTFKTKDGVNFRLAHDTSVQTAFTYADATKFVGLVSGDANTALAATVDASTSAAGVTIELGNTNQFAKVYTATGSNYNDYLRGSEVADKLIGGAGNDALWGGTGAVADTLTGGIGSDTFWYGVGEGDDVITDGTSLDSVMIYNKDLDVSKVTANTFGTDLKLTFESGTLTVNNWTSAGLNTFNIGGTNYKYDSTTSALVKK